MKKLVMTAISIASIAWLAGCASDSDPVDEVTSAAITVANGTCPVTVSAEISGNKGACDEVRLDGVSRSGSEVEVRLELVQSSEVCIEIIEEYVQTVELGTFEAGSYELVVDSQIDEYRQSFEVSCGS